MLDDPLNLACIIRELHRRKRLDQIKVLPPPMYFDNNTRVVYPTFKEVLKLKTMKPNILPQDIDYLAEAYDVGQNCWYIALADGTEVGPFTDLTRVLIEVPLILHDYIPINEIPWDINDLTNYPV